MIGGAFRWLSGKESACNVGDVGLVPGLGRSPGERNGNALQHSRLGHATPEEPGGLQSMGLQRADTAGHTRTHRSRQEIERKTKQTNGPAPVQFIFQSQKINSRGNKTRITQASDTGPR